MSDFFEINKWEGNAVYSRYMNAGACGICKNALNESCASCSGTDAHCSVYFLYYKIGCYRRM